MKNKVFLSITILIFGLLLLSACSSAIPITGDEQGASATQSVNVLEAARATATMMAMQTEIAHLRTEVVQENTQVVATATPEPQAATAAPTATQVPPTVVVITLPTAIPTATPLPCNSAQFIEDVSIPYGTEVIAGTGFTKTWRLRNIGACTWTLDYDLVFYDGDQMNGRTVVPFPYSVAPGQTVDLSVDLIAPAQSGYYRGYWKLRDSAGVFFGLGRDSSPFFVDVRSVNSENLNPLNFVDTYCIAEWTSGAGRLPCQGQMGDPRGSVRKVENPVLESGYTDDEPVLLTQPQMINDGVIRGKYPALHIEKGWHFVSIIGCAYKAEGCDVRFQLDYQIGNGSYQTLASWHEVYDKSFQRVDVDLSSLAGQDVKLILTVFANGSSNQDLAQWLVPHIAVPSQWQVLPTPTPGLSPRPRP